MITPRETERQVQPVGARRPQAQLLYMCVADALESVVDNIYNGQAVRAADAAREILEQVTTEAKAEAAAIQSLSEYRPIFQIDGALHDMRRRILTDRAQREHWQISWGDTGSASIDIGWGVILVDGCDNWTTPSGATYGDLSGHGLTSLLATLNGEHIAITAARVSRWLDKREGSH